MFNPQLLTVTKALCGVGAVMIVLITSGASISVSYGIGVTIVGVGLLVFDKRQAVAHRSRVPEGVLFGIAYLGAALPMAIAMRIARHKTRSTHFHLRIFIASFLHLAFLVINYRYSFVPHE